MTTQREPKKLSFEKVVISVIRNTVASDNGIRNYVIPTVVSTIPECDTITGATGIVTP
ncbi:hypothetical protein ACQ86N_03895 [Puia sp. P3]|uniref:hypothetical protein n=1 Tax=Puia sp. P3 TaxID=3423952 RepID=UPI003D6799CB